MHARYFASAQGRFSSADTFAGSIANPQTLNLYAYVQNNPLTFSDPTGHIADDHGMFGALNDPWSEIPWTVAGSQQLQSKDATTAGTEGKAEEETAYVDLMTDTGLGVPQNSLNNPTSLGTHGKTSAIEAVFVGDNFQGLGAASGSLTVGPGIYDDLINGPSYGLGFTVTTSVFGGGGIGHIGKDSNPKNPGGVWTINQQASVAYVVDGRRGKENRPHDIGTSDPKIRNGSSQYTYWDHPGVRTGDVRNSYSGRFDFTITATNGRETSVLKFRVEISYGRGQPGSVRWGRIR